ncbi:MAG: large repetitive protein [Thermoplasmata archaeon]|jgi:hypothetical protein|nr:large repetitive protein [Thermoplasmata archaeon]
MNPQAPERKALATVESSDVPARFVRLLVALVLASTLLAGFVPSARAAGTEVVAYLPAPTYASAIADDGAGHVYVVSGVLGDGTYSPYVFRYEPATGRVHLLGNLTSSDPSIVPGRQLAAAAFAGGKIYLFGGLGGRHIPGMPPNSVYPDPKKDIVEIDPDTGNSTTLVDTLPTDAFGIAPVVRDGKVFLFGGVSIGGPSGERVLDSILAFDPAAPEGMRVQTVAHLAQPVADPTPVVHGDQVLLLGGYANNGTANPCEPATTRNARTNATVTVPIDHCYADWIQRVTLPDARDDAIVGHLPAKWEGPGAALVGEDVYVVGGVLQSGNLTTAWRIPLRDLSHATVLPFSLPVPIMVAAQLPLGDGIALVGGTNAPNRQITRNVTYIVPMDPPGPTGPPDVAPTADGLRVTWSAPVSDGGATVTGYDLLDDAGHVLATTSSTTWSGPAPATQGALGVRARNVLGPGPATSATRYATGETPLAAPAGLKALPGEAHVALTWTPLADARVTGYQVLRDGAPAANVTGASFDDVGLVDGATHVYRVRALAPDLDGAWSAPLTAAATAAPPAPASLSATLALSPPAEERARLAWPAVEGASGYDVYRLVGGVRMRIANVTGTLAFDDRAPTDPTTGYEVAAWNAHGEGLAASASVTPVPVPAAPDAPSASLKDEGSALVAWQPTLVGGSPALYDVRVTDPTGASRVAGQDVAGSSFEVPLDVSGTYTFSVRVSAPLQSAWSQARSLAYTAPVAPTGGSPAAPRPSTYVAPTPTDPAAPAILARVVSVQGDTATFDAQLQNAPSNTILRWDWGDGTAGGQGASPVHRFAAGGTYTVRVSATAPDGTPLRATVPVTIVPPVAVSDKTTATQHAIPGPEAALLLVVLALVARRRR